MIDVRSVFAAREAILSDGYVPDHLTDRMRPPILESWHRSIVSGAALSIPAREPYEPSMRAGLRAAADPILTRLAERLSDMDTGVLLADQNAVILRRWVADSSILSALDRVNSVAGFGAAEDLVGTNGVGTVIETGQAMQVTGPEHLATELSMFTCVGAPIHHPITRRLEGVITLSCLAGESHPLLTPLLTSTAQDIEHRMLEQAAVRERLLLDAYMVASRSRRVPIAVIGRDLFLAGAQVTDLLRDIDQAQLWEYVHAAASGSHVTPREFGILHDRFQVARCQPIESDGKIIGTIVEFELGRRPRSRPSTIAKQAPSAAALPGRSATLKEVVAQANRLAASGVSMLIEGEPGVGKLTLARSALHSVGVTPVRIDAAARTPEDSSGLLAILQSELSHRSDALLLQHLESLPPETAAAAASLIEDASTDDWTPRIVATLTTVAAPQPLHPSLQRLVDLVAVGRVEIAPLRDRREDISVASAAMLAAHGGSRTMSLSSAAERIVIRGPWPGNLRQLDSTMRGLVATAPGSVIQPSDLPPQLQAHAKGRDLSAIEQLELNAILGALQQCQGNKIAAANSIGISRSTLYRKLRSYHIDPDRQFF